VPPGWGCLPEWGCSLPRLLRSVQAARWHQTLGRGCPNRSTVWRAGTPQGGSVRLPLRYAAA
jgi:hypothetical protein